MKIGYARVSTRAQDLELQREKLRALDVPDERIYVDHGFTGKNRSRAGLDQALAALREGDTLIVPALDRLARNTSDVLEILQDLTNRGVLFQYGRSVYDPHDPMSTMLLTILAAVATAEGQWISLRTSEAMSRKSVKDNIRARPKKHSPTRDARILAAFDDPDSNVAAIAKDFSVSRASIYRSVARARAALSAVNEPQKSGD